MTTNRNSKGQFASDTATMSSGKSMEDQLAELKDKLHADRLDVVEYVAALPGNIRRNVLFSLVGSVNASLIGTAQSMVRRIERDGTSLLELSPYEFEQLMAGPDWMSGTNYARNVNAIAQRWRDDLVALTDQDNAGALGETIDFMIKQPRQLDDVLLRATLEAAGIQGVEPEIIKAKFDTMQQQRAETLAAQRGQIEWVIEQALSTDEEPEFFQLSEEQQHALTDKLAAALERTRDTAVIGVLNRDRRWSFGDLPIISAAIQEVKQHV